MNDATLVSGLVGQASYQDGVTPFAARLGRQGELMGSDLHGRGYEQAFRGNVFVSDSDAVTLAAANTTKGALATVKLINGFFNPANSGKNAVILKASLATVSGTPAGPLFYNFLVDSTISSAATGTIRASLLGASYTSAMTAQTGVVLTNTAAATTALKQLAVLGGPAAIAAGAGNYSLVDDVGGSIIVPPGVIFGLTCVGAGTTHIVQTTLMWEEVPV